MPTVDREQICWRIKRLASARVFGEISGLDNTGVETVLFTYTLCSILDWQHALEQMRRVLKPVGELLSSEHGKAPNLTVQK